MRKYRHQQEPLLKSNRPYIGRLALIRTREVKVKHLNFRPSLSQTNFTIRGREGQVPGFTVTAPHPISSRLWDVMSEVDDFGIFDRQRDNDTQISFWINPGFDIETLRSILVPATYIATVYDYKQFVSFWKLGIEKHMTLYLSQISFDGMIDPDLGRLVFSAWIISRGRTILDNAYRDGVSHRGLNKNFVTDHLDEAHEALNRLIYMDTTKSPADQSYLLARFDTTVALVEKLEADQQTFGALITQSEVLKEPARKLWQDLKRKTEGEPFASPELCSEFEAALEKFRSIGQRLDVIASHFDHDSVRKSLAEILKLTPAKPSKK